MSTWVRRIACFGLLSAALMCGSSPSPSTAVSRAAAVQVPGIQPQAGLPPEVRLRKLHLVRPDLIPYPIDYEVVC